MTITINGVTIGGLKSFEPTYTNHVCEPEAPGSTPIPAYKVGRGQDKFTVGIADVPKTSWFGLMATLKDYMDDEDVIYLADTTYELYDRSKGFWCVISDVRGSIQAKSLGEITLTVTATTDSEDSGYQPA